jgi:hypothetical protein
MRGGYTTWQSLFLDVARSTEKVLVHLVLLNILVIVQPSSLSILPRNLITSDNNECLPG